jgi:hypothetical protein
MGCAMVSASQIRNKLAFYLAGIVSLEAFEDWFAVQTWNVEHAGSKAAEILTYDIEACLTEYTSSHISESELRQEFDKLIHAETKVFQITYEPVAVPTKPVWSFSSVAPLAQARVPVQLSAGYV